VCGGAGRREPDPLDPGRGRDDAVVGEPGVQAAAQDGSGRPGRASEISLQRHGAAAERNRVGRLASRARRVRVASP
jgi:hypothetical protein